MLSGGSFFCAVLLMQISRIMEVTDAPSLAAFGNEVRKTCTRSRPVDVAWHAGRQLIGVGTHRCLHLVRGTGALKKFYTIQEKRSQYLLVRVQSPCFLARSVRLRQSARAPRPQQTEHQAIQKARRSRVSCLLHSRDDDTSNQPAW